MLIYFIGFIASMYLIYIIERKTSYEERLGVLEALALSALSWVTIVFIAIVYVLSRLLKSNLMVKLNDLWKR